MRDVVLLLAVAMAPSVAFALLCVPRQARALRGWLGSGRAPYSPTVNAGAYPGACGPITSKASAVPTDPRKQGTPAADTASVRAIHPATKQEKCMGKIASRVSQRQPRALCASERALLRWYPSAPLSRIRALRNQRATYPLIVGGKRDITVPAPLKADAGHGGNAA